MLKANDYKKVREYIAALKKQKIRISKVLLFGSYHKSSSNKDSDIDLAIVSRDFGKDYFRENKFLFMQTIGIDTRIEPRAISLKEYLLDKVSPIIHEIKYHSEELKIR